MYDYPVSILIIAVLAGALFFAGLTGTVAWVAKVGIVAVLTFMGFSYIRKSRPT